VAKLAGVSTTTASLVLTSKGGERRISVETHQKVKAAAEQLSYSANLLQRSLRIGRTNVISFFNCYRNRSFGDHYMDGLSTAIEHAAGAQGFNVLCHCTFEASPEETFASLNGGLADGLILFAPGAKEPLLPMLRNASLPTVLIYPRGQGDFLSVVRGGDERGMKQVADVLASSGHRRIGAVVEAYDGVFDHMRRLEWLRIHLEPYGQTVIDSHVIEWKGSADDVVSQFLQLSSRPTALFVWHDRAAYRIVEACERLGVLVPHDLSIIGFDGVIWPSTTGHTVDSARISLEKVGALAVSLVGRLLAGEPGPLTEEAPVDYLPGTTLKHNVF